VTLQTRFCPECGSCAVTAVQSRCRCDRCGHTGRASRFNAWAYQPRTANWGADAYGLRGTDPIKYERGLESDN
jgi:ribosomal protein S27AE